MRTRLDHSADESRIEQVILQRLEKALVLEFRASQALFAITKTERLLLVNRDFNPIARLMEQKEACLVELKQWMDERRVLVRELRKRQTQETSFLPFDQFLCQIEPAAAQRLIQLESGVQTLLEQTKSLIEGNQALAQAIQVSSSNSPTSLPQNPHDSDCFLAREILPAQV